MKKYLSFLLAAALLLGLTGCDSKPSRRVQGLVTEVQTSEEGVLTSFLVRTEDGTEIGVLLTEETRAFPPYSISGTHQEIRNAFQAELTVDAEISAHCYPARKVFAGEEKEFPAYEADSVDITGHLLRGETVLADGTALDVLESTLNPGDRTYYLSDGTQLLRVNAPIGPAHSYVGGQESLDDLNEAAQARILAYYEARGLLYDETEVVEQVYALWKAQGDTFSPSYMVHQDVSPSASGDRVMYFLTTATLPTDHGDSCTAYDLRLGDAFDRETGEYLDPWSLFTCPKEEVLAAVLDANKIPDDLRSEMAAALIPERVVIFPGGIQLCFERGSLPSQEHDRFLGADLPEGLMQPWAEPVSMD